MDAGSDRRGSAPVNRRATCGTSRPIQPTMPATATTDAVVAAAAASSSSRSPRAATPSECAVSSPSASSPSRHRISQIASSAGTRTGPNRPSDAHYAVPSPPISQNVRSGSVFSGSATAFKRLIPAEKSAETANPASSSRKIQPP